MSVRELSQQTTIGEDARDLAAFIVLALQKLSRGVDSSASAWEKRGYWVKADRFRMEWAWTEPLADTLRRTIQEDDWSSIPGLLLKVAEHFKNVRIAVNPRVGKPWVGAFDRMLGS